MIREHWELFLGLAAAAAMVWGRLRAFADLLSRVLVVKVAVSEDVHDIVSRHVMRLRKHSPSRGNYQADHMPLRTERTWRNIPYHYPQSERGKGVLMYHGRPLWFTKTHFQLASDSYEQHFYAHFIRGTLAWEDLLAEAYRTQHQIDDATARNRGRHFVRVHSGGKRLAETPTGGRKVSYNGASPDSKLIGWSRKDIGDWHVDTPTPLALGPKQKALITEVRRFLRMRYWYMDLLIAWRRTYLLTGKPGTGKCLGKGTPVLMHDGNVKPVEDIVVGDRVMGPDSQPRMVTALGRGRAPLYKVNPVKGDSWVCNDEHVLTLKGTKQVRGQVIDVSVRDHLAKTPSQRTNWKLWRTGVDYPRAVQMLDPYFVGLWLGDGTTSKADITSMDPEIIEYCQQLATRMGMQCTVRDSLSQAKTISITKTIGKGSNKQNINFIKRALRDHHDASGEKRIAKNYLIADREQRLQLLAGIVDTDGHASSGGYEIITKLAGLRDDYLYLARSLGFAAYTSDKRVNFNGKELHYHRVFISGDLSCVPVKLPRKKQAQRQQVKDVCVTGFDLNPIGEGDYYGFTLDGDGRFLLGDFTVTHNTSFVRELARRLDLPVHVMDVASLGNEELRSAYEAARQSAPCVVLVEDVDGVFGVERPDGTWDGRRNALAGGRLTFDALLQCMDGIIQQDGIITFVTTNHPERLDPALTRAGRADRVIEFEPLGRVERLVIARRILQDEELAQRVVDELGDASGAVVQEHCVRLAVAAKYENVSAEPEDEDDSTSSVGEDLSAFGGKPYLTREVEE